MPTTIRVGGVNRRAFAALAAAGTIALSSCSTFNRNDVAAQVGDRTLTAAAAQSLVVADATKTAGDQLRSQITSWIRVTVLSNEAGIVDDSPPTAATLQTQLQSALGKLGGQQAQAVYESGAAKSPVVCLGAIPVAGPDQTQPVLDALAAGTSFADAAKQFSSDPGLAQSGGIVSDSSTGGECFPVNPEIVTALTDVPIGQAVAVNLAAVTAVVRMRPFAELSASAQSEIAGATISQDQVAALVAQSKVYVDPRYGRWDPATGSIVPLTS
jgi:hypothetical protein